MSLDSCPRCAAFAPAGAERCGVCFSDLRASRAPVSAAVDPLTAPLYAVENAYRPAQPPSEPLVGAYPAPPIAPPPYSPPVVPPAQPKLPDLEWRAVVRREEPALRRPSEAVARDPNARPTWPCLRCGGLNDVDLDACGQCGAGFLQGIEGVDIEIPGLGDVTKLERPHKVALVLAVGGGVVALFLLIASLIGMLL